MQRCLDDSAYRDARPVREATSVRRGRTARTIEARTTTGGIRFNNYVSASRPLIGVLSGNALVGRIVSDPSPRGPSREQAQGAHVPAGLNR